jgi:hypothetical protein
VGGVPEVSIAMQDLRKVTLLLLYSPLLHNWLRMGHRPLERLNQCKSLTAPTSLLQTSVANSGSTSAYPDNF